ncbi:MAG: hypothetical protein IKO10_07080 [Lachnospiraceae bacterium]|nr:hypothetical protein [Lachnospiraceae bacterium]
MSQMNELNKRKQQICAICGKSIEGSSNRDHVYPRAIYKWSEEYLSAVEQKQLVDHIESKDNYVRTHPECNTIKEDMLPELDKLHLAPDHKKKLKFVEEGICKELENYAYQKQQLIRKQNGKCVGCGCDLQEGVLRRKDPEKPRIWENACVVCHECNLNREKFI